MAGGYKANYKANRLRSSSATSAAPPTNIAHVPGSGAVELTLLTRIDSPKPVISRVSLKNVEPGPYEGPGIPCEPVRYRAPFHQRIRAVPHHVALPGESPVTTR